MSSYLYWQQEQGSDYFYHTFSDKRLPTYPYAMRFESVHDLDKYIEARESFIQSTKIPVHCTVCPIGYVCDDINVSAGDTTCRKAWRKIWEYVK